MMKEEKKVKNNKKKMKQRELNCFKRTINILLVFKEEILRSLPPCLSLFLSFTWLIMC